TAASDVYKRQGYGIPEQGVGKDGRANERTLAERAAGGDADARRVLLRRVLPTLRGASIAVLGVGADAEDATQQAAIDVLRGLPSFRAESSLSAWCRTIGVRAALRVARSRRPVAVVEPDQLHAEDASPRLSDSIPGELRAHLEAIPRLQGEALLLRHGMGYTVPELAQLLEASVNTIKSRLLQGRKALRARIRQQSLLAEARASGRSS
ncbi:MAG: sigma-70 family RNA polymerase sigma factor, partial [Nannocystaceae bacterium]|nr:sigma-70 family RNA polymerase sigma factor [Nannocystaceae bacterium]